MKPSATNLMMAIGVVAIGVAIGVAGIYVGDTGRRARRRATRDPADDWRGDARREDRAA
jgi:hypothetical protein